MTTKNSSISQENLTEELSYYIGQTYESGVRDYISLLKPRVMSLVVFTGAVGMLLAPGKIHPLLAIIAVLAIAIGSGAAGAINMWYDRDIDTIMERTKSRPIPAGKINPDDALQYGILLAVLSVFILAIMVNLLSAALLSTAILFYVFIYTMWLKRSTPQNIVIGGAAGSLPPMIGWAAVTNNISLEPFILFLLIFFWTPPHFWALSLYKAEDYKKAGVPMMPVTCGIEVTKKNILAYTIILGIISALPAILGYSGIVYFIISTILSLIFLYFSFKTYRDQTFTFAKKTFAYSILYLFVLFLALVIDKLYFIKIS